MTTDEASAGPRGGPTPAPRTGRVVPGPRFWLRWSLRDLRRRWVQVAAIALVIALGTGTYTGLMSSAAWRRTSYDASYAASGVHHLLVEAVEGTTADRDQLLAAIGSIDHPEWIAGVTTALAVPVQVDASTDDEQILVPGRLVGVEVAGPGSEVDRLTVVDGRPLTAEDADQPVVLMDEHFRSTRDLPAEGVLRISGDREVRWVGAALSPRYFLVGAETGAVFGAQGFAVLYGPLGWAQEVAGAPGQVTEAGVRLADGVDVAAAGAELAAALEAGLPSAVQVTPLEEERSYRILYDDIDGDQQLFTIFAGLILAGAAFAAFNLTGRIVESQRREVGVGMALGVPSRFLAVRPLLVALEIALLGVALGVGVGLAMGALMGNVIEAFFPLPVWEQPFQVGVYARGTLLGIGLVLVASVWPVRRAVRVDPVDAIRTGPRTTRSGGLAPLVQRLPLPGRSLAQMPLRDVLRAPRRTVLTALGIAAMIATLIGVLGMVDSFIATVDRGESEILGRSPDRVAVTLQGFALADGPEVQAVAGTPGVAEAEAGLRIGGTVSTDQDRFEVALDVIDLSPDALWAPTPVAGSLTSTEPALVLSEKAVEDLGVEVGDAVTFRHPVRDGLGYRWVESEVPVGAVHPNPYRFVAYMSATHAGLFDLAGIVNLVEVQPEPGTDVEVLRRELFGLDGVGSVQPVAETVEVIRDTIAQVLDILVLVQWAVLLLAVLIAFNSSSIGADERAREHATMFAFGVPPRTVLAMAVVESAIVGVVATALGVLVGLGLLQWMVAALIPTTLPDLLVVRDVGGGTFATAVLLGIVAVALAPVLTLRKLRRMDIPSTLRVVE